MSFSGGCRFIDISFDATAQGVEDPEWRMLSLAVIFLAVLGAFSVLSKMFKLRGATAALTIFISFISAATIWNAVACLWDLKTYGPSSAGLIVPLVSILWCSSYWLAYLRVKRDFSSKPTEQYLLHMMGWRDLAVSGRVARVPSKVVDMRRDERISVRHV